MEMKSIISYLFLLQAIINIVNPGTAKPVPVQHIFRCRPTGKYKSISYKNNIDAALAAVAKNIGAHKGFYHATSPGPTEIVKALGLCPGYIKPDICAECVKHATQSLLFNCPDDKEAMVWATNCMLRYSDQKFLGQLDDWAVVIDSSQEKVQQVTQMDKALSDLVGRLQKQAAGGSPGQKFAYGSSNYGPGSTVYAACQCTPDLTNQDCSKCFIGKFNMLHPCCSGKKSARVVSPYCYIRYGHEKFDEG